VPEGGWASYLHADKILVLDLATRSKCSRKPASRLRFVPLQGHWERVNTPVRDLTSRERRLVRGALVMLALAAIGIAIVAIATKSSGTTGKPLGAGCIRIEVPSTMGAGASDFCGQHAASFCRGPLAHRPPLDATALPKCREAGYSVTPQ
jgi:hypothetical protein